MSWLPRNGWGVKRNRTWYAWSGDINDVGRLARLFEQEAEELEQSTRGPGSRKVNDSALSLTIMEKGEETSGSIKKMLEQIDRRTVQGLEFQYTAGDFDTRILVTLRNGGAFFYPDAVKLEVESSDSRLGKLIFVRLSDEIEKGVPWWSRVHTVGGRLVASACIFMILGVAALLARPPFDKFVAVFTGPDHKPTTAEVAAFLTSILLLLLFAGIIAGVSIYPIFFPKFEITGDHGGPSGSRRLVAIVALLATIPVGIFVNWIS